ncbi:hypothetical protein JTB14_020602 [Gonioctena quinquepunctata]|nr:hypothetical protein JTB14_020602 [Gonioctena quinquepunctata]
MNDMYSNIGEDVCGALPGLHTFNMCDTVSAFAGKGKATALKLVRTHKEFVTAMSRLGDSLGVSDETMIVLETFVCRLHNNSQCSNNDMEQGTRSTARHLT